jgi:hypothetical protein
MLNPGSGRPIDPGFTGCPGVFATCRVVSVWPNPSRTVTPHALPTCSMTSGLSGSPAPTTWDGGVRNVVRSAWISMRHTVGGAQKLVTPQRSIWDMRAVASKRV